MNAPQTELKPAQECIQLAHGSGGRQMRELIESVILAGFGSDASGGLEDQARLRLQEFDTGADRLAFTTDSFVVDPLFFPGGDIGTLAINGTVNDLAVGGAEPLALSCGLILEEGLPIDTLRAVIASMRVAAERAGVGIVTGDTKVVPRGAADKLFINTAGIGLIRNGLDLAARNLQPGDRILCNGLIGDHGAAIVDARGELALENSIVSDCRPLNALISSMLAQCSGIRCMRDATRGGVATVLNEFARDASVGIRLDESALPVRDEVRGLCEILGLDPRYLANEGLLLVAVCAEQAAQLLELMQVHPDGKHAAIIAEVVETPAGRVTERTRLGGERILDMLSGEQLPRIC